MMMMMMMMKPNLLYRTDKMKLKEKIKKENYNG